LVSGGWVQTVEQQRWALADLAAFEAADGLVDADGRGVLVELDDDTFDATLVSGSGVVVGVESRDRRRERLLTAREYRRARGRTVSGAGGDR
jgi:hypothetical protein